MIRLSPDLIQIFWYISSFDWPLLSIQFDPFRHFANSDCYCSCFLVFRLQIGFHLGLEERWPYFWRQGAFRAFFCFLTPDKLFSFVWKDLFDSPSAFDGFWRILLALYQRRGPGHPLSVCGFLHSSFSPQLTWFRPLMQKTQIWAKDLKKQMFVTSVLFPSFDFSCFKNNSSCSRSLLFELLIDVSISETKVWISLCFWR